MACQYIDDGYTVPFFIRGVKGLYPDLRGERRPTLPAQRNAAERDAGRKATVAESLAVLHKIVKAKVASWDATDKAGNTLPINEHSFGHIEPLLWDRLLSVVMGYDPGDLPEDAAPEQKDELDAALAAIERGDVPGDAQLEADVKNY